MDIRESILHAGTDLLRQQGITALTQPKVAAAAGVKQSHLTYYFPKRTDLLLGIAEHTIETLMAELSARIMGEAPQAAIAKTLTTAMVEGIPPRVMLGLIVAADADPALRPALQALVRQVRMKVQSILETSGMSAGNGEALLFHATIVGLAVMHDAQRTDESARELRQGIATILQVLDAHETHANED